MMFSIREILEATGGKLAAGGDKGSVKAVSTDTRTAGRHELFVAIKGDIFDGHDFVARAAANGVRAFLVSREGLTFPTDAVVILVEDTVKAYGLLARFHRRRFKIPVMAVTGSAGKTTTKELIAAVLKTRYRVLYNKGTENNHVGVPATLLKIRPAHEVAVIETGTNHPGEIAWLASIVEPTVAVFTNVGPSHLAGLGTPAGVFKEKAALIKWTSPRGAVVVNADDPWLARILTRTLSQRVISYGVDKQAHVKASSLEAGVKGVSFQVRRETFRLKTPVWGNVHNALAAIACGRLLKVPVDDIRRGLARFVPSKGRQVFHRVRGMTVIDDTYNANPLSFRNAVRTLAVMKSSEGRAVLVGADMLELGPRAEALHREVGLFAAHNGVDVLFTCGALAASIAAGAKATGAAMDIRVFSNKETLLAALCALLAAGDVVLVKGSRGMRMESVIEGLLTDQRKG